LVSGACGNGTNYTCPNYGMYNVYVHDFGSILAFTEYNFGMTPIVEPYYADYNAPDWGPGTEKNPTNTPLLDFFGLYPNARTFVHINTDKDYKWFEQANQGDFPSTPYPADHNSKVGGQGLAQESFIIAWPALTIISFTPLRLVRSALSRKSRP
jgi:hypothetical protein